MSVGPSDTGVAIANLLPLTTVILKKKRLISETRKLLSQEAADDAPIRVLYERVLENVFGLLKDLRHDSTRLYFSSDTMALADRP